MGRYARHPTAKRPPSPQVRPARLNVPSQVPASGVLASQSYASSVGIGRTPGQGLRSAPAGSSVQPASAAASIAVIAARVGPIVSGMLPHAPLAGSAEEVDVAYALAPTALSSAALSCAAASSVSVTGRPSRRLRTAISVASAVP